MYLTVLNSLTQSEKEHAIESLIEQSSPRQSFFMMVSLAILMATVGLLANSVAIIIGSMLIAPLLYPLLSLSLGIVLSDRLLMLRSIYTLTKSSVLSVILAMLVTLIFSPHTAPLTPEILSRSEHSVAYLVVALIAGFAASFAFVKPQLNEGLAGVAISVALIPPLAVVGIGLARLNWVLIQGSLILFLLNAVGIIFSSVLVFSVMNLQSEKRTARTAFKKDNSQILKEVEKAKARQESEEVTG